MNKLTRYAGYLASMVFGIAMVNFLISPGFEEEKWYLIALFSFVWLSFLIRVGFLSNKAESLEHALTQVKQLAEKDSEHFGPARKDIAERAQETLKTM